MTSMRVYLNAYLAATAPGVTLVGAAAGVLFAPIGMALSPDAAGAWSLVLRRGRDRRA